MAGLGEGYQDASGRGDEQAIEPSARRQMASLAQPFDGRKVAASEPGGGALGP